MYYRKLGKGERTLVLLHSGGLTSQEWAPQVETFGKRYKLLIPDFPGHGQSLLGPAELSIAMMAEAVIDMLNDEGVASAHICGSSMGAAVAMWLCLHYPERVSKAVFYRISYQKNEQTHAQTKKMSDPAYWQQFGLQEWLSSQHLPQGGPDAWEDVIARVSEVLDPNHSDHAHSLANFATLAIPVLIITGDRDPVSPLEDALALYHTIPDCGLWVLPYATHITATNTWRAQEFAEEVIRFLGKSEKK